jgi:hypothetical protein
MPRINQTQVKAEIGLTFAAIQQFVLKHPWTFSLSDTKGNFTALSIENIYVKVRGHIPVHILPDTCVAPC